MRYDGNVSELKVGTNQQIKRVSLQAGEGSLIPKIAEPGAVRARGGRPNFRALHTGNTFEHPKHEVPATETFVLGIGRSTFFDSSFLGQAFLSRGAQDKFCTPLTTLKGTLGNGTDRPPQRRRITPESPQLLTNRNQAALEHFSAWFGFPPATPSVPQWYATGRGGDANDHAARRQGRQHFPAWDGGPEGRPTSRTTRDDTGQFQCRGRRMSGGPQETPCPFWVRDLWSFPGAPSRVVAGVGCGFNPWSRPRRG